MSTIPPKQSVKQSPPSGAATIFPEIQGDEAPDIDDTAALVSLRHAANQEGSDSFPVLKAFQEYLESERARARRRMLAVSLIFSGLIVLVVLVFAVAGVLVFGQMRDNQERLWAQLNRRVELEEQAGLRREAAPPPAPVKNEEKDLTRLDAVLEEIKRDNRLMREEWQRLAATPEKTSPAKETPAAETPAVSPESPPPPSPAVADRASPPEPPSQPAVAKRAAIVESHRKAPPPRGYSEDSAQLRAPGAGGPVTWRLLIPED